MHWIEVEFSETVLGVFKSRYPPAEYLIGRVSLIVAEVVAPTVR